MTIDHGVCHECSTSDVDVVIFDVWVMSGVTRRVVLCIECIKQARELLVMRNVERVLKEPV